MKVGLLSDIHANQSALQVVLDALRAECIDTLIVCGDSVGYYYSAKAVFDLLSDFEVHHVLGNHEVEILKFSSGSAGEAPNYFGSGLSRDFVELSEAQLTAISSFEHPLGVNIDGIEFLISHGSPWNLEEYLYPNSSQEVWEKFLDYPQNVFIIGHTHHQMLKRIRGKVIINPGSVGQSRSSISCAEWAVIDTKKLQISFFSEKYDSNQLIAECLMYDPEFPFLVKHLRETLL
jgi:putative phosphoesterase